MVSRQYPDGIGTAPAGSGRHWMAPDGTERWHDRAWAIWYRFVNFFKSQLRLHFLLDSFETRCTYCLGVRHQTLFSQNLEIWIFWFFMNISQIFIEIATSIFVNGRLYVRGRRFFRSVWVNWFENLPQEGQIHFWYHSKWRADGHLV